MTVLAITEGDPVMTYALIVGVPAPAEVYDAMHAEVLRRCGSAVDGLLVHVGRSVDDGFQVFEVWESREAYDRFLVEIMAPVMEALTPPGQPQGEPPAPDEVDLRGLVIPSAGIAH